VTRRLTLALIATVAVTVVVVGAGTLALTALADRERAEDDLRRQVESVADSFAALVRSLPDEVTATAAPREVFATLAGALRVSGLETIAYGADGRRLRGLGRLPDGVDETDLDTGALLAGEAVSGRRGDVVFAAAPFPRTREVTVAVVATREAGWDVGGSARWLVVSSLGALVVAALVARRLGRRLSEPVRAAEAATGRIAAGDLATRLPEPAPGAHDPLDDLARSVNSLAADLERSRALERQFLLSISHDLRTPLTSIRGWAEAVADDATPDPRAAAGVILAESRRLERLVADLLDLARLDAHRFSLSPAPVDVGALVDDVAGALAPEADAAGVRVTRTGPAGTARVVADPDRLVQVLTNLGENALKFADGEIDLEVEAADGEVRITVADDGPGIAPVDLPHVFERLYVARARPRRKESGSGLGLAIARELTRAMGGDVVVRSVVGEGARFTVRLPAADPA
jgi:signal transduction histidine kinase